MMASTTRLITGTEVPCWRSPTVMVNSTPLKAKLTRGPSEHHRAQVRLHGRVVLSWPTCAIVSDNAERPVGFLASNRQPILLCIDG